MSVFVAALLPSDVNIAEVIEMLETHTKCFMISTKPDILLQNMTKWSQEPSQPDQLPLAPRPAPTPAVQVQTERSTTEAAEEQLAPRPTPPRSAAPVAIKMEPESPAVMQPTPVPMLQAKPATSNRSATSPGQPQQAPRPAVPSPVAPVEVKQERSTATPAQQQPASRPIEVKKPDSVQQQPAPRAEATPSFAPIAVKIEPESPVAMSPPLSMSTGHSSTSRHGLIISTKNQASPAEPPAKKHKLNEADQQIEVNDEANLPNCPDSLLNEEEIQDFLNFNDEEPESDGDTYRPSTYYQRKLDGPKSDRKKSKKKNGKKKVGKKALGPFPCDVCQKQLTSLGFLERHKKTFHS